MNCQLCNEPILPNDAARPCNGIPRGAHRECLLRSVVGGIGHHRDHALWCVTRGDPDGGMTFRESARAVDALFAQSPD